MEAAISLSVLPDWNLVFTHAHCAWWKFDWNNIHKKHPNDENIICLLHKSQKPNYHKKYYYSWGKGPFVKAGQNVTFCGWNITLKQHWNNIEKSHQKNGNRNFSFFYTWQLKHTKKIEIILF